METNTQDSVDIELDMTKLLGFQHIETPDDERTAELREAIAIAFNKRGGGGETPTSDRRLKRDIRVVGEAADDVPLYRFRYLGDDREFTGVMAQDLLNNPHCAHAVGVTEHGYYCVDYAALGLQHLVSDEMLSAGSRAVNL